MNRSLSSKVDNVNLDFEIKLRKEVPSSEDKYLKINTSINNFDALFADTAYILLSDQIVKVPLINENNTEYDLQVDEIETTVRTNTNTTVTTVPVVTTTTGNTHVHTSNAETKTATDTKTSTEVNSQILNKVMVKLAIRLTPDVIEKIQNNKSTLTIRLYNKDLDFWDIKFYEFDNKNLKLFVSENTETYLNKQIYYIE